MAVLHYQVPVSLGIPKVLAICNALNSFPIADGYDVDFSRTQHFEPFGMLLVASAIRRLQDRCSARGDGSQVFITGRSDFAQGHSYAHRMGFWWSLGDDGRLPFVKKSASVTTIPITRLSYADLFREAGLRDPIRAELVSKAAADLATTLSGNNEKSPLWLALEYCFREMIRNAFEHGQTDSVWYAGSTRPAKDDVQIAVLDSGRGVRVSLSDNPNEQHVTDIDALQASLRPGVSRNAGRIHSRENLEKLREDFPGTDPLRYDNSGFGLTLTSNLAREAGQFAIVSGSASLAYVNRTELTTTTSHAGTAVRVVLHPSRLEGAFEQALEKANRNADGKPRSGSLITASMMTRLGLRGDDT